MAPFLFRIFFRLLALTFIVVALPILPVLAAHGGGHGGGGHMQGGGRGYARFHGHGGWGGGHGPWGGDHWGRYGYWGRPGYRYNGYWGNGGYGGYYYGLYPYNDYDGFYPYYYNAPGYVPSGVYHPYYNSSYYNINTDFGFQYPYYFYPSNCTTYYDAFGRLIYSC